MGRYAKPKYSIHTTANGTVYASTKRGAEFLKKRMGGTITKLKGD